MATRKQACANVPPCPAADLPLTMHHPGGLVNDLLGRCAAAVVLLTLLMMLLMLFDATHATRLVAWLLQRLVGSGLPQPQQLTSGFTQWMTQTGMNSNRARVQRLVSVRVRRQTATIFYFYARSNSNATAARAMARADERHVAVGLDGAWRSPRDLDARELLPALREHHAYQRLLCEASGNLALANNLALFVPTLPPQRELRLRWIGSASIKRPLPSHALDALEKHYLTPARAETVFSWASAFGEHEPTRHFVHTHQLWPFETGFADLAALIDDIVHTELGLPNGAFVTSLPRRFWSYKQALLMPRALFEQYTCFVRAFVTGLLRRFYNTHERRQTSCFLRAEFGRTDLCWAFLLERLPNYWAWNAGYRLFNIPGVGNDQAQTLSIMRAAVPRWEVVPPAHHNASDPVRRKLRDCRRHV
jgi:hypothetical protein